MKTLLIIDANLGQARAYMAKTLLGACLTEISVNNQQRFHYASPAVS